MCTGGVPAAPCERPAAGLAERGGARARSSGAHRLWPTQLAERWRPSKRRAGHAGHDGPPPRQVPSRSGPRHQLTHLVWRDGSGQDQLDLIVFPGDAALRHVPQCTDGFVVLLEFSQTGRREFFWSQEPRKKGSDWASDADNAREKGLVDQANGLLGAPTAPAAAPAAGFGGLSPDDLLAMLSGGGAAAAAGGGAAAAPAPRAAARPRRPPTASGDVRYLGGEHLVDRQHRRAAPRYRRSASTPLLQPDATAAAVDEAAAAPRPPPPRVRAARPRRQPHALVAAARAGGGAVHRGAQLGRRRRRLIAELGISPSLAPASRPSSRRCRRRPTRTPPRAMDES